MFKYFVIPLFMCDVVYVHVRRHVFLFLLFIFVSCFGTAMYANKGVYTGRRFCPFLLPLARCETTDTGLEHRVVCPMASVGFWLGGQCPLAA